MKRFLIAICLTTMLLVGCKIDGQQKKEYNYIRIINESGKNVLWSIADGTDQPCGFNNMKTNTDGIVITNYGDTYTLYCYAYLGDDEKYEDGYSYHIRVLSKRAEKAINIDCQRTYIRLGYDGNVITFIEEKF